MMFLNPFPVTPFYINSSSDDLSNSHKARYGEIIQPLPLYHFAAPQHVSRLFGKITLKTKP